MSRIYEVTETCEITGRGTAVLFDELLPLPFGAVIPVTVRYQNGESIAALASHESLLRRFGSRPSETSALLVQGVKKDALPLGCQLELPHEGCSSARRLTRSS